MTTFSTNINMIFLIIGISGNCLGYLSDDVALNPFSQSLASIVLYKAVLCMGWVRLGHMGRSAGSITQTCKLLEVAATQQAKSD